MLDRSKIGFQFAVGVSLIERGRVRLYAKAIDAADPVYSDLAVARARGFRDIPIPPTYLYSLELERAPAIDFLGEVGARMGRLLHGEQSLIFHRQLCAGEQLHFHTRIEDIFDKGRDGHEFFILQTQVRDAEEAVVAELRATYIVPR